MLNTQKTAVKLRFRRVSNLWYNRVGASNSYGHPTEEVLSRLRDTDVEIYRTDLQGDIIAVSEGSTISITTERNSAIQTNETQPETSDETYIGNKNSKNFTDVPAIRSRQKRTGYISAVAMKPLTADSRLAEIVVLE